MKTYISGKISGLEHNQAEQRFQEAEELLHSINLKPVNPMKNGLKHCSSWNDHIVRDIELLLSCKAILMLSNWRESKGARIEKKIADEMEMVVLFENNVSKNYSFVQRVENAIHETTGLLIKDYNQRSRNRLAYYSRLIFTYQCRVVANIPLLEIAKIINRDRSTIYQYPLNYQDEVKFNPNFRMLAQRVDEILVRNKALTNYVLQ